MPRYVILEHFWNGTHWDLMLEAGGILKTWALEAWPGPTSGWIQARRLADHRPVYLEYEGPVSGDRGMVKRVDSGIFQWIEEHPDRLLVRLDGTLLRGMADLEIDPESHQGWRFRMRASG